MTLENIQSQKGMNRRRQGDSNNVTYSDTVRLATCGQTKGGIQLCTEGFIWDDTWLCSAPVAVLLKGRSDIQGLKVTTSCAPSPLYFSEQSTKKKSLCPEAET